MFDSDALSILLLLLVVISLFLVPPGPGTPLRAPVRTR